MPSSEEGTEGRIEDKKHTASAEKKAKKEKKRKSSKKRKRKSKKEDRKKSKKSKKKKKKKKKKSKDEDSDSSSSSSDEAPIGRSAITGEKIKMDLNLTEEDIAREKKRKSLRKFYNSMY